MASAFSNHSLSFAPPIPPAATTPSKTPTLLTPSLRLPRSPRHCRPISRYCVLSSPSDSRRRFGASFRVAVSDPKIIDGEEENQPHENGREDKAEVLKMEALIQAYKEAVLNGEGEGISGVETAICRIEKEKNDLFKKIEEKKTAKDLGKEQFLRLTADFENFRKLFEKERLSFTSDIQEELIESLLPIVDSFEKTKQQLKPETEKEKKIDTSYQGIYKQLVETLRASRVAAVETVGKKFDPSVHEAVARVESEKFKEGIIVHEVRRGFVLGDRLLRPAMVKVSSGPGVKKAPPSTEDSVEEPITDAEPDEGPASISDSS